MAMTNDDDDVWFEPKSFGYGTGLPVAWRGWALLGAYLASIIGLTLALMPRHPVPYYVVTAAATITVMIGEQFRLSGSYRLCPYRPAF